MLHIEGGPSPVLTSLTTLTVCFDDDDTDGDDDDAVLRLSFKAGIAVNGTVGVVTAALRRLLLTISMTYT